MPRPSKVTFMEDSAFAYKSHSHNDPNVLGIPRMGMKSPRLKSPKMIVTPSNDQFIEEEELGEMSNSSLAQSEATSQSKTKSRK